MKFEVFAHVAEGSIEIEAQLIRKIGRKPNDGDGSAGIIGQPQDFYFGFDDKTEAMAAAVLLNEMPGVTATVKET